MTLDRLKAPFIALIRSAFPRIDYLALYPGTVVLQRSANAIDVQPDNPRLPGLGSLPLFLGAPEEAVQVQPGARVLIGFQGGDPQLPFVALWGAGALVQSLSIAGGGAAAARSGDPVAAAAAWVTWFGTVGGVIGTPPPVGSLGAISAGSTKVEIG